jgi:two-component system sensor histidine kinase BaeS
MRVLIEDLLDVVRLQRGTARLDRQNVVLQEVVDRVLAAQQPDAERKGIQLMCDRVETPLDVCADPRRITQLIANLVTNALQATPPGGTVTVRLRPASNGEQGQAYISVHDSGAGIEASLIDQVFDPFFHAKEGEQHSLGLGLTIAREIVELHDGAISVESEVGRGSTFKVELPLDEGCADPSSGSSQQDYAYANR